VFFNDEAAVVESIFFFSNVTGWRYCYGIAGRFFLSFFCSQFFFSEIHKILEKKLKIGFQVSYRLPFF